MAQARAGVGAGPGAEREVAVNTWRASMGGSGPTLVAVLDGAAPGRTLCGRPGWSAEGDNGTSQPDLDLAPAAHDRAVGASCRAIGSSGKVVWSWPPSARMDREVHRRAAACARLESYGFTTRTAYFGMARGNLPGVALARKVLGVPEPGGEDKSKPAGADERRHGRPLDHPGLRKAAAWFYALEYGWRYAVHGGWAEAARRGGHLRPVRVRPA